VIRFPILWVRIIDQSGVVVLFYISRSNMVVAKWGVDAGVSRPTRIVKGHCKSLYEYSSLSVIYMFCHTSVSLLFITLY
jgi:hypothetical protein